MLTILLSLLVVLFLIQIIFEFKNNNKGDDFDFSKNNVSNLVKRLESNTVDVNEKLNIVLKQLNDNTIANLITENNIKGKVNYELSTKVYNVIKIIERNIADSEIKLTEEITSLKNNILDFIGNDNTQNLLKKIDIVEHNIFEKFAQSNNNKILDAIENLKINSNVENSSIDNELINELKNKIDNLDVIIADKMEENLAIQIKFFEEYTNSIINEIKNNIVNTQNFVEKEEKHNEESIKIEEKIDDVKVEKENNNINIENFDNNEEIKVSNKESIIEQTDNELNELLASVEEDISKVKDLPVEEELEEETEKIDMQKEELIISEQVEIKENNIQSEIIENVNNDIEEDIIEEQNIEITKEKVENIKEEIKNEIIEPTQENIKEEVEEKIIKPIEEEIIEEQVENKVEETITNPVKEEIIEEQVEDKVEETITDPVKEEIVEEKKVIENNNKQTEEDIKQIKKDIQLEDIKAKINRLKTELNIKNPEE